MRLGKLPSLARALLARVPVSYDAAKDAALSGPLASALVHPVWAGTVKTISHDCRTRPRASRWPRPFEDFLRRWKA
jgi:hypothetical protein